MRYPARFVRVAPLSVRVGGSQLTVTRPSVLSPALAAAFTVSAKAGRAAVLLPSDTLMTMFEVVPMWWSHGVPESLPVEVLKLAQPGLLLMAKVSLSLFASLAVGWKVYALPAVTLLPGAPAIFGAAFAVVGLVAGRTRMANAGSDRRVW